jgi:hypothetical protein
MERLLGTQTRVDICNTGGIDADVDGGIAARGGIYGRGAKGGCEQLKC